MKENLHIILWTYEKQFLKSLKHLFNGIMF